MKPLSLAAALALVTVVTANEAHAFNVRYHVELTEDALRSEGLEDRGALQIAQAANVNTDLASIDPFSVASLLHFDNMNDPERVARRWDRINEAFDRTLDALVARGDATELLVFMGIVLHGIQDFYSHSNWVEVDWEAQGLPADAIWEDVPREKVLKVRDRLKRRVFSGAYGTVFTSDDSGHPAIDHEILNKDHARRPNHERAFALARRASRRWAARFRAHVDLASLHASSRGARRTLLLAEDVTKRVGCWDEKDPVSTDQKIADDLKRDLPVGDAFDLTWHAIAERWIAAFAWRPASASPMRTTFSRERLAFRVVLLKGFKAPPATADVGKTVWGQSRR
jgi:hypothetical protein